MLSSGVSLHTAALAAVAVPVLLWAASIVRKIAYIAKCRSRADQLPGLPCKWIIGNLHQLPRGLKKTDEFTKFGMSMVEKFPYCYHFQVSPLRSTVVVCHPRTVKAILKSSEPKDTLYGGAYNLLLPWLGRGLLISDGQQWFRNRRLLTPAFHFDILKPYMAIYNQCADVLLDKWNKYAVSKASRDINEDVSLCTLNVIMRCAFSCEEDVQRLGKTHPYVEAVYKLSSMIFRRVLRPWTHFDCLFALTSEYRELTRNIDLVHKFAAEVIEKRKQEYIRSGTPKLEGGKNKLDFLDILLSARDEDGSGLSDQEIRQEVDTFLFEGHDTTASGISWILYALAKHPHYQQKAREEIDSLLKHRDTDYIEWEDLNQMPYLTQCIKEGMRLYSPVPIVVRQLSKALTLEGVELLPDTSVVVGLYMLHHNPAVWGEDHMQYKPDRFLPENISKMDSHAFCPFSAGPRNCIGQNFALYEEKTILARLLHRYEFTVDKSHPEPELIPELVMRSMNGIHLNIHLRNTTTSTH